MGSDIPSLVIRGQKTQCFVTLQSPDALIQPTNLISKETTITLFEKQRLKTSSRPKNSSSPTKTKVSKQKQEHESNREENVAYLQQTLARDLEVWYNMDNLKHYIRRLKESYNCNPDSCFGLQERLHHHLMDIHRSAKAQTNCSLGNGQLVTVEEEYKPQVEKKVRKWLNNILFHSDEPYEAKEARENRLNQLIENITDNIIQGIPTGHGFEERVKDAIDRFLNKEIIWYPGSKRDRMQFTEGLKEHLYKKVAEINTKFYDNVVIASKGSYTPNRDYVINSSGKYEVASNVNPQREYEDNDYKVDALGNVSCKQKKQAGFNYRPNTASPTNVANIACQGNEQARRTNRQSRSFSPNYGDNTNINQDCARNLDIKESYGQPILNNSHRPNSGDNNVRQFDPNSNKLNNTDRGLNYENRANTTQNFGTNQYLEETCCPNTKFTQNYESQHGNTGPNTKNENQFESNLNSDGCMNGTQNCAPEMHGPNTNFTPNCESHLHGHPEEEFESNAYFNGYINTNSTPNYEPINEIGNNYGPNIGSNLRHEYGTCNNLSPCQNPNNNEINEGDVRPIGPHFENNISDIDKKTLSSFKMIKRIHALNKSDSECTTTCRRRYNKDCPNEVDECYYDGPDLLGNYRRKIKRKYRSAGLTFSDPHIKKVVTSSDLCGCIDKEKHDKNKSCGRIKVIDMEQEISEWLKKSNVLRIEGLNNRKKIIDKIISHVASYLRQPSDRLSKAVLKSKIIKVLVSLSTCSFTKGRLDNHIVTFAGDLANRLIGIQSRLECSEGITWKCDIAQKKPYRDIELVHIGANDVLKIDLRHDIKQEVEECLLLTKLAHNKEVEEDITDVLMNHIELIRQGMDELVYKEITAILEDIDDLSDMEIKNIVNSVVQNAKDILVIINNVNNRTQMNTTTVKPCLSGTLSIYTSEHEVPSFNVPTSTPKDKKNAETGQDSSQLSPEEKAYTNKLATSISKWMKTMPDSYKARIEKDMEEVMANDLAGEIADYVKVKQLVPELNTGDDNSFIRAFIYKWLIKFDMVDDLHEAKHHTKGLVKELGKVSVPNLTKMQQGPRRDAKNKTMKRGGDMNADSVPVPPIIAEAALAIEIATWINENSGSFIDNKAKDNRLLDEFVKTVHPIHATTKEDVKSILAKIVKPKEKNHIDRMADSLLRRITKLTQDKPVVFKTPDTSKIETADCNRTMKKFILKYIECNSDTDDPLTRNAYGQLLTSELLRLSPTARKEVYEKPIEQFCPEKLTRELQYIKDVSDWLRNIPIEGSYNVLGNEDRVEFVVGLAKNILNVEDERILTPDAMDYNRYLGGIICEFMGQLPILKEQRENVTLMIDQLLTKIVTRRNDVPMPISEVTDSSIPGVIEVFIRIYGAEIADDELKLEAFSARMLKEVQIALESENTNANAADTDQIETSGENLVKRFGLELNYAKEISDWLKNLPIVGPIDVTMISDLAGKMAAHENKQINDQNLKQYIIKEWITKLPLDKQKQLDIPFIIQQLIHRMDKVNQEYDQKSPPTGIKSPIKPKTRRISKSKHPHETGDPSMLIKVVDKWCENLPIQGKEKDEVTQAKNEIACKLFQKIGDLENSPHYSNNDAFYNVALENEIDVQLNNIPENFKLAGNKDKLKQTLLENLSGARQSIKASGDSYKQKLKDILETSLPNPVPTINENPGFELYKNHLTHMFILDNFDQGNCASKLKYEKKIKSDIDKYYRDAQDRNAIPLTKDQLYNHLYSALYKAEVPKENDLKSEVEKVKTKYEVQEWFENLPIRKSGCKSELLEYDQKIDVLTEKLHHLEKEKESDKMSNEIAKWLKKMTLLENQEDIDKFSNTLHEKLKFTEKNRKSFSGADSKKKSKDIYLFAGDNDDAKNANNSRTKIWVNPNASLEQTKEQPVPKSAEAILDVVGKWCDNIPMPSCMTQEEIKEIKNGFLTKLTMKISELNSHPYIFYENQLYDHLLGEEIDKLLASRCENLPESKDMLRKQLIEAINAVKPIILEERARYKYRKDIEDVINNFIGTPEETKTKQSNITAFTKEEMVNDFIEFQYNRDDDEGKLFYKIRILQALLKYNMNDARDKNLDKIRKDTILKGNQMLCELLKLPTPGDQAIKAEVEEIRMKHEVNEFFDKISPPSLHVAKNFLRNLLKNSLAKQINEIEKTGHNKENDEKIKTIITRATSRLRGETKEADIDAFIKKLKESEKFRRAPPSEKDRNESLPAQFGDDYNHDFNLNRTMPTNMQPQVYNASKFYLRPAVTDNQCQMWAPQPQSPPKPIQPPMMSDPSGDAVEPWSMSEPGPQAVQQNVDYIVHNPVIPGDNQAQASFGANPELAKATGESSPKQPKSEEGQSLEVQIFDYNPPNQMNPPQPLNIEFPPQNTIAIQAELPNADLESDDDAPYCVDRGTGPSDTNIRRNAKKPAISPDSSDSESDSCMCQMYPDMSEVGEICRSRRKPTFMDFCGYRRMPFYTTMMPFPLPIGMPMPMPLSIPMQFPYLY